MVRGVESKNVPISSAERLSIRESVINITEEEQVCLQKLIDRCNMLFLQLQLLS